MGPLFRAPDLSKYEFDCLLLYCRWFYWLWLVNSVVVNKCSLVLKPINMESQGFPEAVALNNISCSIKNQPCPRISLVCNSTLKNKTNENQ